MVTKTETSVSLYDALIGLTTEPYSTTLRLIENRPQSAPYKLVTLLVVSVFLPLLSHIILNQQVGGSEIAVGLLLASVVNLVLFVVLESILLKVLGIDSTLEDAFAVTAYATTPLTLFVWLVYAFNLGTSGSLTIIDAILSGNLYYNDKFLLVVPYAFIIVQANCALILYYSLKKLGELHPISAIVTVLLSIVAGYISSAVGLLVGEVASPGLMEVVSKRLVPNSESIGTFIGQLITVY